MWEDLSLGLTVAFFLIIFTLFVCLVVMGFAALSNYMEYGNAGDYSFGLWTEPGPRKSM